MSTWKLEDAKNRFSQVVNAAMEEGPQVVTRHGREAVVVLSIARYRQLVAPAEGLVDFMRRSPLAEALASGELDLPAERSRDLPRPLEL